MDVLFFLRIFLIFYRHHSSKDTYKANTRSCRKGDIYGRFDKFSMLMSWAIPALLILAQKNFTPMVGKEDQSVQGHCCETDHNRTGENQLDLTGRAKLLSTETYRRHLDSPGNTLWISP